MEILGNFLALVAALLFAISTIYMRLGLIQGNIIAGLFLIILVHTLLGVCMVFIASLSGAIPTINYLGIIYFSLAGVVSSILARFFRMICMEHIGASRSTSFKVISPVFTITIGSMFLHEYMSILALCGTVTVLLGLIVVIYSTQGSNDEILYTKGNIKRGVAFGLLTALAFSLGNILRKVGLEFIPSSEIGFATGAFTALVCIITYVGYVEKKEFIDKIVHSYNINFIYCGVFSGLGLYVFFLALRLTTVSKANVLVITEVLITILLSSLVIRKYEAINSRLVLGSILVFAGLILVINY
ncbi:MAG: EamA family transporter [Bacillota bacterium]